MKDVNYVFALCITLNTKTAMAIVKSCSGSGQSQRAAAGPSASQAAPSTGNVRAQRAADRAHNEAVIGATDERMAQALADEEAQVNAQPCNLPVRHLLQILMYGSVVMADACNVTYLTQFVYIHITVGCSSFACAAANTLPFFGISDIICFTSLLKLQCTYDKKSIPFSIMMGASINLKHLGMHHISHS